MVRTEYTQEGLEVYRNDVMVEFIPHNQLPDDLDKLEASIKDGWDDKKTEKRYGSCHLNGFM